MKNKLSTAERLSAQTCKPAFLLVEMEVADELTGSAFNVFFKNDSTKVHTINKPSAA